MVFSSKSPFRFHASSLNNREEAKEGEEGEEEKMTTYKMKGLFKGLRYISHIFEEEKEQEIQIGFPTDVKHVAHIGWDGPSVESASWMKEYKSPTAFQSAPLGLPGETREEAEIKWVSSEDSKRGNKETMDSPARDPPDVPKSSRRHHSKESNPTDSPKKKDHSTRSRRRSKDSSEGSVKSSRSSKDSSEGSVKSSRSKPEPSSEEGSVKSQESSGPMTMDSPSRGLPKKSRRKKSKESVSASGSGPTARSRSKESVSENGGSNCLEPDRENASECPKSHDEDKGE